MKWITAIIPFVCTLGQYCNAEPLFNGESSLTVINNPDLNSSGNYDPDQNDIEKSINLFDEDPITFITFDETLTEFSGRKKPFVVAEIINNGGQRTYYEVQTLHRWLFPHGIPNSSSDGLSDQFRRPIENINYFEIYQTNNNYESIFIGTLNDLGRTSPQQWFLKNYFNATQGNINALCTLGMLYLIGYGTQPDEQQAQRLFDTMTQHSDWSTWDPPFFLQGILQGDHEVIPQEIEEYALPPKKSYKTGCLAPVFIMYDYAQEWISSIGIEL